MSAPIRVLLADDHAVVRAGVRAVLAADAGLAVVGEAASAAEAVALAAAAQPDVVLLDITMPGGSGLEAVARLREVAPRVRVLMLSVHDQVEYVLQAVRAGAHGYVRKDAEPADLRRAIRAVHEGGAFFSPDVARHLTAALRGETPQGGAAGRDGAATAAARLGVLTARERAVLARIARGHTNKQIAGEFGISVRTVEAHRDSLMKKLAIRNVAGLTKLALEAGLLDERQ